MSGDGGTPRRTLGGTIARNTMWNAAGRVWEAGLGLVLTWYIVRQVGVAGYGLWGMVAVFTGYVALADFGLSSGYVKFVAEHTARGETNALSAVVSTGFTFYLVAGAMLVGVAWPAVDGLLWLVSDWFDAPAERLDEARFLLRGGLLLFAGTNVMAVFPAVLNGLQRMDLTNLASFAASVVKAAAVVVFLENGHGLRGLLYAQACAFVLFAACTALLAFKLLPALRLGPGHVSRSAFGRLFGFGWRAQVARLSNLVMFETDMVVAAAMFGQLGLAGFYKLGVDLANKMRQLPVLLVSALVPAASQLDAEEDAARLARLYVVSSKYLAAVTFPLAFYTAGSAGLLMRAWLGPGYETSAWVLRILALGYVANILAGAGVSVVLGKGRTDLQMKAGLLATGSNIALTVLLATTVGFWGIPVATAISMVLSWAWFTLAVRPVLGVRVRGLFLDALAWPLAAALPGAALAIAADLWSQGQPLLEGRPACLALLLGVLAAHVAVYQAVLRLAPFFDAFDVQFLRETAGMRRVPLVNAWLRTLRRV